METTVTMVNIQYEHELLMKCGNYSWTEWISYLHANPAQLNHACDLSVLYFYFMHAHSFCALVKWYTVEVGTGLFFFRIVALNNFLPDRFRKILISFPESDIYMSATKRKRDRLANKSLVCTKIVFVILFVLTKSLEFIDSKMLNES